MEKFDKLTSKDEIGAIKFFQSKKLLHSNVKCNKKPKCESMKVYSRMDKGNLVYQWRCSKCSTTRSIRADSFIETSKLSVLTILKMIIHWAIQTPYEDMEALLDVCRQTCAEYCHRLRHIVSLDFDRDSVKLGGH